MSFDSAENSLSPRPSTDSAAVYASQAGTQVSFRDYLELTKPRLSLLSIITAIVGYLAADGQRAFTVLTALIIGTSLAAGGAAVLNQWWEHKTDAKMARTKSRPIPSGLIEPRRALLFGLGISLAGCAILGLGANLLSCALAAFTIFSYILVYTPLKKVTVRNTIVGAIPGAVPPLIGWAAATGQIGVLGWVLFGILFTWQMPHFYAIAWTYRNDYAQAGYRMLPKVDPSGMRTALESFLFAVLLVGVSLLPAFLGYTSAVYGAVAIGCGAYLAQRSIAFLRATNDRKDVTARKLFFASILYLPVVLAGLVLDILLLA